MTEPAKFINEIRIKEEMQKKISIEAVATKKVWCDYPALRGPGSGGPIVMKIKAGDKCVVMTADKEFYFDGKKIESPQVWSTLVRGLSTEVGKVSFEFTQQKAMVTRESYFDDKKDPVTRLMKLRREERLAVEKYKKAKREMWKLRELIAMEEQKEEELKKEESIEPVAKRVMTHPGTLEWREWERRMLGRDPRIIPGTENWKDPGDQMGREIKVTAEGKEDVGR